MKFTIEKALVKKGNSVEIEYSFKDELGAECRRTEIITAPLHPNLKRAIDSLTVHLAVMTGYIKPLEIANIEDPDPSLLEGFHATGFTLGGGKDNPGVQIHGRLDLQSGPPFNFNTPFRRFTENEKVRYCFMDVLQSRLESADNALRKFMDGSERGEPDQLDMFKEADKSKKKDKVTKAQIAEPVSKGVTTVGDVKILPADADAQKRVKEGFAEAEVVENTENKTQPVEVTEWPAKTSGRKKRVPQSPTAPGGIIEEPQ